MSRAESFVADLWSLWAGEDHPVRAELQAKAYMSAKTARVIGLRAKFEKRKRSYGLKG